MATNFGPCADWPVTWPCDLDDLSASPAATGIAVGTATEIVWSLSGRQFGLCQVTLRPCRRSCYGYSWPWGWEHFPGTSWVSPALVNGQWFNVVCGVCGDSCSCTELSEVVLPAPIHSIVEVKVDGTPLVTGAYRVDDDRYLVRIDGGAWPWCNDLNKADTETGTWSVSAWYGRDVPQGGSLAVGEMACEILKALQGSDCRLPDRVTQLVRQGVTISFPDVSELFDRGQTGLYLVDLFVGTWNPHHLQSRARTYDVDAPRHRRVAT